IGVVSNDKDTLTVKLAKNLTLGDENGAGSIEFGTTDSQGDIDTSKPHSALDDGGLDVADDQGNEAHYGADQAKIADADGNSTTIHSTDIVVGDGGSNPITVDGDSGRSTGPTN